MSVNSKIPYTEATWNPIRYLNGWMCTKVSAGCLRCYAETFNGRFGNRLPYSGPDPAIGFRLDEQVLDKPLHWRKPRRIFVQSMGDLFHPDVPFEFGKKVRDVAGQCLRHTFQFLTKRPKRMFEFQSWLAGPDDISIARWSRNCWGGTSVESQKDADERIPWLLKCGFDVRFVSVEPMLGPIRFPRDVLICDRDPDEASPVACIPCLCEKHWVNGMMQGSGARLECLDWLIIGCESGPNRRPCKLEWVRDLVEQCDAATVPVFVKQLDIAGKVSKDPAEWPEWARRREYPTHQRRSRQ